MAKQKMKTVDMSVNPDELDAVIEKETLSDSTPESTSTEEAKSETKVKKVVKKAHVRSRKYQAVRSRIDRTKFYLPQQAVELVCKTSYSSFAGTVIADLIVKDEKVAADVVFPHSTGKTVRVAIASDELIKAIEAGNLDFDILVTHPSFMPKLAKFAKVLGPKGLMPNPKNQTVTTDPDKRAKELAGGQTTIKTERKAPLIHAVLGKTNQEPKEVLANLKALVKAIGVTKITKLVLSATMSPGVKVDLSKLE